MRIILITSNKLGSAECITKNLLNKNIKIEAVVYNKSTVSKPKKKYIKKFKKILRIGIFGAINGYRIRNWYTQCHPKEYKKKSLAALCNEHNVKYIEIDSFWNTKSAEIIKSLKPDLAVSISNSYIPSKIYNIPTHGMINVHHEILPEYQNAQSIIWQIFNYSRETGYTIHKISRLIDQGEIIYQKKIPIHFYSNLRKTVKNNYFNLWVESSKGLSQILCNYQEKKFIKKSAQPGHYTTPNIYQYGKILFIHKRLYFKQKNL